MVCSDSKFIRAFYKLSKALLSGLELLKVVYSF